jgi:hypothetical protein
MLSTQALLCRRLMQQWQQQTHQQQQQQQELVRVTQQRWSLMVLIQQQ